MDWNFWTQDDFGIVSETSFSSYSEMVDGSDKISEK